MTADTVASIVNQHVEAPGAGPGEPGKSKDRVVVGGASVAGCRNAGNLFSTGNVEILSDEREKAGVRPLNEIDDRVLDKINPIRFNRIGTDRREYGFSAQNLQQASATMAKEDDTGRLWADTMQVVSLLVHRVKKLTEIVEGLAA